MGTQLGSTKPALQVEHLQRHSDGFCTISQKGAQKKLLLVAPAIVALENAADISVISSRDAGQQAVLKFAAATEAIPVAGCFPHGNQVAFGSHGFW